MAHIFFRNDDVRETLDKSLIDLTNIFIAEKIPLTHVVEPYNVTNEVAEWLLTEKSKYPKILEIGQHGYDHKLKAQKKILGKVRKGEFGYDRNFKEQYEEIRNGKKLMDKFFGANWYPIFTFPFGGKNMASLIAADSCGFKIMNDHHKLDNNHKIFYAVGRLLRRNFLLQRPVSYNLEKRPRTNLFNININISFIKKYINDDTDCIMYTLEELKSLTKLYLKENTIGIVFHHRYHNTQEKLQLVKDYINWLRTLDNISFVNQEFIYEKFRK